MSARVFVIADTHFGHKGMAEKRGFESVEEHDELIVENWNGVVNKIDTVYILGDVTMEKATPYPILSRLNGHIKVVSGNHDLGKHCRPLLEYVNNIQSSVKIRGGIMTHIPIHPSELDRYGINVHGHLHEKSIKKFFGLLKDKRYICVSCEQVNYTPVELVEIRTFYDD